MPVSAAAQDAQDESPSLDGSHVSQSDWSGLAVTDAPDLVPDRTAGESMLRLRVEPEIRASGNTTFNFAYEQRLHYASAPTVGIAAIGILPSEPRRRFGLSRSSGA